MYGSMFVTGHPGAGSRSIPGVLDAVWDAIWDASAIWS